MMKSLIFLVTIGLSIHLAAVPLRLISPNQVNTASGFIISSTGSYLLSDDAYNNSGASAAILITNSNVTLDLNGKTLGALGGFGIEIIGGFGNITIKNGTFFNSPVTIGSNCSDIYLENLKLTNLDGFGINASNCQRIYIKNCFISNDVGGGGGAIQYANVAGGDITDTIIVANSEGSGMNLTACSGLRITGVESNSNGQNGMSAMQCNNLIIRDSQFSQNSAVGISFIQSTNCLVENCSMIGNSVGLGLSQSGSCIVSNCNVMGSGSTGILSSSAGNIIMDNCTVSGNGRGGASFISTSSSIVSNCVFFGNINSAIAGITIDNNSGGNIVRYCTANSNVGPGFQNDAGSTTLLGNLAFNNTGGNYTGLGPVSFIKIDNGGQLPLGGITDPRVDNISIS